MSFSNSKLFEEIALFFTTHGFKLYMVGGTSRDFLLQREITDYDFATDATPTDMREFLPDANYQFSRFGTVSFKHEGKRVEITTLRKEDNYLDFRRPSTVTFVKNTKTDYVRRDFTINAIYIDSDYKIYDYCDGLVDLKKKIIRMIGDPNIRFQEDPLRMLRALRFKLKLGFELDNSLHEAIIENAYLLKNLNQDKIRSERGKVLKELLSQYDELVVSYNL